MQIFPHEVVSVVVVVVVAAAVKVKPCTDGHKLTSRWFYPSEEQSWPQQEAIFMRPCMRRASWRSVPLADGTRNPLLPTEGPAAWANEHLCILQVEWAGCGMVTGMQMFRPLTSQQARKGLDIDGCTKQLINKNWEYHPEHSKSASRFVGGGGGKFHAPAVFSGIICLCSSRYFAAATLWLPQSSK